MSQRAALYLRISEDRTGEGLAVERQREDGRKLIASRGWTLSEEFVDNDISAAGKKKRPGFEAMLAAARDEEMTVVVAYSMDRLTRGRREYVRMLEMFQQHRVSLAFTRGGDLDLSTAMGRWMADQWAGMARVEIEIKSERQRRQNQQAAEAGKPAGAPRAFGYRKGGMEIEPAERYAVEQMYSRFLAGDGLGTIADWLNRQCYSTPKGYRWRPQTVRVVLANPRNAGIRGRKSVVAETENSIRYSMWHDIVGQAAWPGIVSEETWRAALAILQDPSRPGRHTGTGPNPRHLLSRVAQCGVCGEDLIAGTAAGGVPAYKCRKGGHVLRRAHQVELYVQHTVLSRLRRADAVDLLAPPPPGSESLDKLRAEITTKRTRRDQLAADWADGVLDRDQMRQANERLRAQIADLEAQIAKAGETDVVAPLVLAENTEAAWAVWDGYSVGTRQSVLRLLCRIVLHRGRPGRPPAGRPFDPDTVDILWRGELVDGT